MDAFAALMGGGRAPRADGEDPNVLFYKGEIASEPNGAKVDEIHRSWRGDFRRLELHHGYIQWLFPVFENAGMNFHSSPLTKEGAATIRASEVCSRRVLESYRLMLHFYGFSCLTDATTGAVARDPDAAHAAERLENLHERAHNWLRISRIITSLGELGFARYKKPLVAALRKEVEADARRRRRVVRAVLGAARRGRGRRVVQPKDPRGRHRPRRGLPLRRRSRARRRARAAAARGGRAGAAARVMCVFRIIPYVLRSTSHRWCTQTESTAQSSDHLGRPAFGRDVDRQHAAPWGSGDDGGRRRRAWRRRRAARRGRCARRRARRRRADRARCGSSSA